MRGPLNRGHLEIPMTLLFCHVAQAVRRRPSDYGPAVRARGLISVISIPSPPPTLATPARTCHSYPQGHGSH